MSMPGDPHFGREQAQAEVAAIREAVTRVEAWGEGRDLAEVEAALMRELRGLGGPFVPSSEIKIMARDIAEPGWSQRDPDAWEAMLAAEEDEARADAQLVHQVDRTTARLEARVDRCWGVRSFAIGCHRTLDGFQFEVCIDPWSPRLARKVKRRAGPTAVVVKPLDVTGMSEDRHDPFDRHQQAIEAAAARIGPDRRRLTDQEATQIVVSEFSARGIDIRARAAASIARQLLHPRWPFRHPIRARREGWTWRWRSN